MNLEDVYPAPFDFELGKTYVLREGTDVTIAACGVEVAEALAAADILAADGISAEVLDVSTVKPIDVETIVASAKKTGHIVTCEEHSVLGGMGSAISEVLSEQYPVLTRRIGIPDMFGMSGEPKELIEHFGLDAAHIAQAAREVLAL
jgi:transketolase